MAQRQLGSLDRDPCKQILKWRIVGGRLIEENSWDIISVEMWRVKIEPEEKPSLSADLTESSGAGMAFQTWLRLKQGRFWLLYPSVKQPLVSSALERTWPWARQWPSAVANAWWGVHLSAISRQIQQLRDGFMSPRRRTRQSTVVSTVSVFCYKINCNKEISIQGPTVTD